MIELVSLGCKVSDWLLTELLPAPVRPITLMEYATSKIMHNFS